MSWLTDFRTGVATASAAESSSLLTFRSSGNYTSGQVGIYGVQLPATPDEAVALSCYVLFEDTETEIGVQFRFRAKRESRLDLIEDSLSNSWSKRWAATLGGVSLIQSQWSSGASLGQDTGGRLMRTATFNFTAHRALTHRI